MIYLLDEEATMNRSRIIFLLLSTLWLVLLLTGQPASAAPLSQADPAAQCAEGVKLFNNGQKAEALPLLEAGFAGRETATFATPDDEGICALALGLLRNETGDRSGALEAYRAALDIFQTSHNRELEGVTLYHIGWVYAQQRRNEEALTMYEQALAIHREVGDRAGEGGTLNDIGLVYDHQGYYREALDYFRQSLAIFQEIGNRAGEGVILKNIGRVYYNQGRYEEALALYEQALAIHRKVGDRAEEGATLHNIAAVYADQKRYEESLTMYERALAIYREVGDRAGEGTILNNIGGMYLSQGRYEEALELYDQALAIHREVGDRTGEGTTLNDIGLVYYHQGHYEEANYYYQQALANFREVGNRAGEGATLTNIGGMYRSQGRYEESLTMYERALAIYREVGDRAGEGTILTNIGMVYYSQGRYEEALALYEQALAIHREVDNRAGEGGTLTNIGLVYDHQGRYEEALALYEQALALHREMGARPVEGTIRNNLGGVYADQGRYEEALALYEQALAIHREVGDRAGEGGTLTNLGGVYADQGRYEEALALYEQALTIYREVGDRAGEGTILTNIGRVYKEQERYEETIDYYQQAMDIFEAVRATAGSEEGRAGFIAQHAPLYTQSTNLFHQLNQEEAAFFTSERGRARTFLDSLATGEVQLSDNAAANLLAQEQEAYTQRQAVRDALAQARALNPPDPVLVADLEAQLVEAEQAYATVQAKIEARHDQLADLVPGRSQNVLGVPKVQTLLDEQTTLLAYYVLDEQTLVFLITPDNFEVIELDVSQEELTNKVNRFRKLVDLKDTDTTREAAQELHQMLIAPLSPPLSPPQGGTEGGISRLMIIPHNVLHYLPFAALLDLETEQFLLERYSLVTLPSASALPFIQENSSHPPAGSEPAGGFALVIGNPTTGDFDATVSLTVEREGLGALPFAEEEAKAIAALYGVEPLLGKAATEGAVRERVAEAGIVHLAAHGYYNPVAPLSSLIALAPDDPSTGSGQATTYDGWLTVGEVYGLDLSQTDLVVLSACQTQLGELSAGDELVGLTRAFIFAGTPTVVASLWNVDDEATSLLMERFYTHLKEGISKAEAMRQAQLETMAEYPDPYYWAAFVMSGDGGEVSEIQPLTVGIGDVEQTTSVSETKGELESHGLEILWWGWFITGCGGLLVVVAVVGVVWWWRRTNV
jgi:tetratricopeptide (TPR) repeat protein